jgi:rare lipoprotein A
MRLALGLALALALAGSAARADIAREQVSGPAERWTASWYGLPYHGRRAADGSRFDRMASTAAHRSLPFGTRLRVSYEGRVETVTVTDRGPFINGRHLDLSEGTARRLGLHRRGVAAVTVQRIGR